MNAECDLKVLRIQRKEVGLQPIYCFYHSRNNGYMVRLDVCNLHQSGYRTLSKVKVKQSLYGLGRH